MKPLALALLTTALMSGTAAAQDVTLRLSHWVPPTHPIAAKSLTPWTEAITAASGGTIKFEIFPAGQLGKPEDHYSAWILKLHDLLQKRWSALTGHVHQNNFRTTLIEFRKQ